MSMERDEACCGASVVDLPDDSLIRRQASYFKALSDPARIRILYALEGGERCACELMTALGMSQTLVAHHVKILRQEGIISDRKAGKWVYYTLIDLDALTFVKAIQGRR